MYSKKWIFISTFSNGLFKESQTNEVVIFGSGAQHHEMSAFGILPWKQHHIAQKFLTGGVMRNSVAMKFCCTMIFLKKFWHSTLTEITFQGLHTFAYTLKPSLWDY